MLNAPITARKQLRAALMEADGATYDAFTGEPAAFTSGFQVGGTVPAIVDPTPGELDTWLATRDRFTVGGTYPSYALLYVGVWKDDEGRRVYDFSDHITDRRVAWAVGQARGEAAIWDWAAGRALYL